MIETDSPGAKIICILFSFILLGAVEMAFRFIAPESDHIGNIIAILRQDSRLIWKVRENIDVQFQGKRVKTNSLGLRNAEIPAKLPGSLRIVCMGESLTFGWGVDEHEAYPRLLEQSLRQYAPADRPVEVINAGQVGYSSFQGLRLFEQIAAPLAPDIITVPYVINDIDRFRFFRSDGRSDQYLPPGNSVLTAVENLLQRSAVFNWMSVQARRLRSGNGPPPRGMIRVSEKEYEQNLRAIIRAARQRGVAVVFLKMPVNLPQTPALAAPALQQSRELFARGKALLAQGNPAAAHMLEQAAAINPGDGEMYAALGTAYAQQKERAAARRAWTRAKDCEAYRCRERGERYNRIMEQVAASENVPLVDAAALFSHYAAAHDAPLFNTLKNDPIHPTPLGHRLIADALSRVIREELPLPYRWQKGVQ